MKSGPIAGVMTNCPFGLRWLDASLARGLLWEIPADAVRPVSLRMRARISFAVADAASAETRRTIEHAESRQQALALLLMSPEFQRG